MRLAPVLTTNLQPALQHHQSQRGQQKSNAAKWVFSSWRRFGVAGEAVNRGWQGQNCVGLPGESQHSDAQRWPLGRRHQSSLQTALPLGKCPPPVPRGSLGSFPITISVCLTSSQSWKSNASQGLWGPVPTPQQNHIDPFTSSPHLHPPQREVWSKEPGNWVPTCCRKA